MTYIFRKLKKTIAVGVLCATVMCGNVLGDVFEAKFANGTPVVIENPDVFFYFVKAYHDMNGLQNDFTDDQVQWQMLGYAVFFPEGSNKPQQVYVAKKREYQQGQALANNNPNAGGHVLDYSSNMHTERQLAIIALEEAIETLEVADADYNDDAIGPLLPGAKVPATARLGNLGNIMAGAGELKGELHIFTKEKVCQAASANNNNFCCAEYYNELARLFPSVEFHIYTGKSHINFDKQMDLKFKAYLGAVLLDWTLNDISNGIIEVSTSDGKTQAPVKRGKSNGTVISSYESGDARLCINKMIATLNGGIKEIDIASVENLMTNIFSPKTPNIRYHVIIDTQD